MQLSRVLPLLLHPSVIVSFFLLLILLLFQRNRSSGNKLSLPPSPPRLLAIGNLHQLGTYPHRSLGTLSDKYRRSDALAIGLCPDSCGFIGRHGERNR
ncbi:hypothetical protein TIFTF001_026008 [Ficus carica]|uniref:Cytochrome P450 n=1 Tax=Ficus carica TaxID=3494 RepID=A0AA88APW0_FICCA|nr:hypothetical protein TIFTF001_026008 [Ficus carica]